MKKTFPGGWCLNIIKYNKNLDPFEKLLLILFGSELNIKGDFREWRYVCNDRFVDLTGRTRQYISNCLKTICRKGYIDIDLRQNNHGKLVNFYRLTEKLFQEYDNLTNTTTYQNDIEIDLSSNNDVIDNSQKVICEYVTLQLQLHGKNVTLQPQLHGTLQPQLHQAIPIKLTPELNLSYPNQSECVNGPTDHKSKCAPARMRVYDPNGFDAVHIRRCNSCGKSGAMTSYGFDCLPKPLCLNCFKSVQESKGITFDST